MRFNIYLKHLDTLIAAIVGFYAVHLFTKYSGVGISPDSIMYASTATNIQAHGSLITFNETPLVFFPVFYPFFLGVIQFISRIDPITAGPVINACLFASVIFVSGWMLSKFIAHSNIYKWLILIAIILSPALLEIYSFLWSETLFILEVMLFILAYHHYLQKHTTKALVLVALVAAISCITRYAGITLIATGGLLLLLDNKLTIPVKIKHICLFSLTSSSLLISNLVFNRLTVGLSTGTREPSITPLNENLYYTGTVFNDWGALGNFADHYAIPVTAIIILALIALLVWKVYKGKINSYENVVIAFTIVYGLFIILLATFSRFERINSRLLSPMFIPLLISCTSWVPDILAIIKNKSRYVLAGMAIVLMLAFEYSTLKIDLDRYDDEMDYGVPGYSDDSWNKSEFIKYLKAHKTMFKPGIPIYTDANEAVYLFTGMPSELIPHKFFQKDVNKFYSKKRFYLIWFDNLYNKELISLQDITTHKKLVKIGEAKQGEIYLCDEK
ncbi:hypothetical protein [Mucilaginibacter sp.]|uniref:hypothetical protein n=1 Tax=Mucilaginibacter sp. TaxID=1882438 RepID=UPI0026155611|nr:hypothetical protein [Mucilaginibacter sp.]MDB5032004.1 hypothetical protein [Mucilaginibacter sp.]